MLLFHQAMADLFTRLSRNILLSITGCFILGAVCVGQLPQTSPALIFIAAGFLCFAYFFLLKKLGSGLSFLMIFFLVVGFVHTGIALQPPKDPARIYNRIAKKNLVTLVGTVTSMVAGVEDKTRFELELDTIIYRTGPSAGEQLPTTGKIRLSMRGQPPSFLTPGRRILAVATVDRIRNYQTPGIFNYTLYMHSRGIYSSGWIRSSKFIEPLTEQKHSISTTIRILPEKIRQQISRFIQERCDPAVSGLYQALLIGDRSGLSPEIKEQFARTGCMHLLAISGLHVGLLALLVYGLLSGIMKRSQWLLLHTHVPTLALALTFPILFFYAFIAGMNTPVFRSLIMAAVFLGAILVRRQHSILNLIAAAALLILVLHPLSLFTASFQLSFAAILAITLIYPRIITLFVQEKADRNQTSIISNIIRWPITALMLSLAATIGILPFLLYHFNRFSPIGPLMNLLIEPLLCFIALPLGLAAIPLIVLAPNLAGALLQLGGVALHLADGLTQWAGRLPFASIWTITPSIPECILYFSLLLFVCTSGHRRKFILFSLGVTLLFLHFATDFTFFGTRSAEISYLDVGQGTSTLIENPDGTNILIDGGGHSSKRFNVGKNIIAPFLRHKRIRHIDQIIITHPDSDHFNGLGFIVQQFHPGIVYINGQAGETDGYRNLLDLITLKKIPLQQAQKNKILHEDPLCSLVCVGMPGLPVENFSENNSSLVLRLQCGKKYFLFPGDIEERAEALLIQQNVHLQADVLLAPHHGSKTSSSRAFIQTVKPKLIIVSAGRSKKGIFPTLRHQQWWRRQGIDMLITGIDGTITCRTDGKTIQTTD